MDLKETYLRRARHETLHAGYAVHCDIEIERVVVHPTGVTTLFWPCASQDLWKVMRRNPLQALGRIKDIVGVLTAPEVCLDVRTTGPDLAELRSWQQVWEVARLFAHPEGPPWVDILKSARWQIISWHGQIGRKKQLDRLAEILLEHNSLNGNQFATLYNRLDLAGVPRRSPYAMALV